MKRCSTCHKSKPFEEFYKNKRQPDGYANQCIPCYKASSVKYRTSPLGQETREAYLTDYMSKPENQETIRRVTQVYTQSTKGKLTKQRWRRTPIGKAAARRKSKRWSERNREKIQAYWTVKEAIRQGKLPRPETCMCPCGQPAEHWHHHLGYAKEHRLDVVALCHTCHQQIHNPAHVMD